MPWVTAPPSLQFRHRYNRGHDRTSVTSFLPIWFCMPPSSPSVQTKSDPWLAVNYALLFPGLGQIYSRHWTKGISLSTTALGLLGYAVWNIFGATGNTLWGLWAIALWVGLYAMSILDAYRGTQPGYAQRIQIPKGRPDAWYAVFLSQVLPGLGHLYAQRTNWGGGLLVLGLSTAWLANLIPTLVPLPPLIWAFACYHIHRTFPYPRAAATRAIALLVLGIFLMRLILGSTPGWIQGAVEQCIVPSESMLPTLQVGDRLFVRRNSAYRPRLGDIVVFSPPPAAIDPNTLHADTILFVKRIIGLPGQRVEIAQGRVYIDQTPLTESYITAPPTYHWGPEIIPRDRYFVLGDNRNASNDSHVWGTVPAKNILGRAYKIYWPPPRIQSLLSLQG